MNLRANLEGGDPADEDHQAHDEEENRETEHQFERCEAFA